MAGAVVVKGQRELVRAFSKFSKDLAQDLVWELEEAADPVRQLTTQKLLGELQNMPRTPFYADMRIGVSKGTGSVYVAPDWRRGTGAGTPRPTLAVSIRKRMQAAVDEKAGEVERGLEKFIDRLADDWGRGI
jgi:hypothetical protein